MNMIKRNKFMIVFLTLFIPFIMFLFTLQIANEANHDHNSDQCPICHQIQVCENTLKQTVVKSAKPEIKEEIHPFYIPYKNQFANTNLTSSISLVNLKVKLLN